jgi:hypothetical protein
MSRRSGGEVVEATADDPGRNAPQRDVVDQLTRAAPRDPAAARDRDRRSDGDRVTQPVDVERERTGVHDVRGRARDRREERAHTNRMATSIDDVSCVLSRPGG